MKDNGYATQNPIAQPLSHINKNLLPMPELMQVIINDIHIDMHIAVMHDEINRNLILTEHNPPSEILV